MIIKNTGSWRTGIAIDYDIATWECDRSRDHVLSVKFWGDYWGSHNRKSVEGGSFMHMVMAAAFANPRGPGVGLVVDLSELNYSGGDMLFYWKGVLGRFELSLDSYGLALVWSEKNSDRVRSLLEEEDDHALIKASYFRLEEAVRFLFERAQRIKTDMEARFDQLERAAFRTLAAHSELREAFRQIEDERSEHVRDTLRYYLYGLIKSRMYAPEAFRILFKLSPENAEEYLLQYYLGKDADPDKRPGDYESDLSAILSCASEVLGVDFLRKLVTTGQVPPERLKDPRVINSFTKALNRDRFDFSEWINTKSLDDQNRNE